MLQWLSSMSHSSPLTSKVFALSIVLSGFNDCSYRIVANAEDVDLGGFSTTTTSERPSLSPTMKPDSKDNDGLLTTTNIIYAGAAGAGILLICCLCVGLYYWKFNNRDLPDGWNTAGVPPPLPSDKTKERVTSMTIDQETMPAVMRETDNYDGTGVNTTDTTTESQRTGEPATYKSSDADVKKKPPLPDINDPTHPNAVPPWERKSPPMKPAGSPHSRPKSPPRGPVRPPPSGAAGRAPPPLPGQLANQHVIGKQNRQDRGVSDLYGDHALPVRPKAPSLVSIGESAVSTLEQDKEHAAVLGIQPQVDPSAYSSTPGGGVDSSDEDDPGLIDPTAYSTPGGEGPSIGPGGLPAGSAMGGEIHPTHSWEGFGEEAYAKDPDFDPFVKPILRWTVANVRQWFDCHLEKDLQQYSDYIGEHAIDGQELKGLDRQALKEIGITKFGHQNKLLRAIEQLYAYQNSGKAVSAGR